MLSRLYRACGLHARLNIHLYNRFINLALTKRLYFLGLYGIKKARTYSKFLHKQMALFFRAEWDKEIVYKLTKK